MHQTLPEQSPREHQFAEPRKMLGPEKKHAPSALPVKYRASSAFCADFLGPSAEVAIGNLSTCRSGVLQMAVHAAPSHACLSCTKQV